MASQLLLIFSLIFLSRASPLPPLLSLNCTSPSLQSPPLQILFGNLSSRVAKTGFITSTSMGFHGIMQCRLHLSPTRCNLCARNAVRTVSTLCPNSSSGTAWFDGCYLQYHHQFSHEDVMTSTNISCSRQIHVMNRLPFEVALERLLILLRAELSLVTHHQFWSGEVTYGNQSKIYGVAECIRLMSPEECERCVGEGIEWLQKQCGGKNGAIVVAGNCAVRFEGYYFLSDMEGGGGGGGGGSDAGGVGSRESVSGGSMCLKSKVGLAWGIGAACLIGILLTAWLLRRSVVNTSKVAAFGSGDGDRDDETGTAR